jgi:hypothetical protein
MNITDMTKTFREGMHENPSTYGTQTIFSGGAFAVVTNCGEMDNDTVIKIFCTTQVTNAVGPLIEDFALRTLGNNGTFTVMTPDGSTVPADTQFTWMKVRF